MSTPIVHFDTTRNNFTVANIGFGALKMYLVISLPLVLLTLLVYGVVYIYDRHQEKKQLEKEENERNAGNEKLLYNS